MNVGKVALVAAALVVGTAVTAQAQVGTMSNNATVALDATRAAGITVSTDVASLSLASITDNSDVNDFGTVSITTYYTLSSGASVQLVGYFADPAKALTNVAQADDIPSTAVQGSIGGGYASFAGAAVGAVGTAGGSLTLGSWALAPTGETATQTTNLQLRLNLTGAKKTTKVGTYNGVLNLRAIVQ